METGDPAWLLPLLPDVHIGRRKQRGQELRELWEAPPSVPPHVKRDIRVTWQVGCNYEKSKVPWGKAFSEPMVGKGAQ